MAVNPSQPPQGVPVQTQLFDSFEGEQEGIHSAILPDIFSSGGSKNVWIDKFARVKKINGFLAQNNSALVSNTGSQAMMGRSAAFYRATSGGSVTRQVVGIWESAAHYEIRTSTNSGATWTFQTDLGSTPIGIPADFAQFADNLFITTGKVAPKKWNGSAVSTAGGTQSPTITPTAGSSGNLNGTYQWRLLSMVGSTRQLGSVASTALALSNKQGSLSWSADGNGSVTGYELYRTTGTGGTFYFVDYIDGRLTTSYTDNISDATIINARIMQEHGDAPPTTYYCESHKQRMWWGRTDAAPTTIYWSDAGLPDSVYSSNNIVFSDADLQGDFITGMVGNFGGLLVVFTERAVWTVSGTGALVGNINDWTRTRSNAQVGCVNSRAAARVPAGAQYTDPEGTKTATGQNMVAYFTPLGDVRIFDGLNDQIISGPVSKTLSTLNYAQRAKVWCLSDTTNKQIIWFYPDGSSGECNKAVCWNYRWGVWYPWPTMSMASGCEIDGASTAFQLLTNEASTTTGGFCYLFFDPSLTSFNGSNINAAWMTKTLRGGAQMAVKGMTGQETPSFTKRWRWADLVFTISQNVTLTLEWMPGYATDDATGDGSSTVVPSPGTIVTSDGFTVVSAGSDTFVVSLESAQGKVLLHYPNGRYLHDTGLRIRVSDNAQNGAWALEAMTLAYQILPGMNRRLGFND